MKRYAKYIALAVVAIAILRIIDTYSSFNHTVDAPIHIACGLEWLQYGTYSLEAEHPPLSRIATAIGPYLAGVRLPPNYREIWQSYRVELGNIALVSGEGYFSNLLRAKLGVLFFFVMSIAVVWTWARTVSGAVAGMVCVFLYSALPPVLAHGSVAETDMTLTANLMGALLALLLWLKRPNLANALFLGLMFGLSLISKLTTLLFFPACAFVVCLWYWYMKGRVQNDSNVVQLPVLRVLVRQACMSGIVAFFVFWAGYGFEIGDLHHSKLPGVTTIEWISWYSIPLRNLIASVADQAIFPAPPFFEGVQDAAVHAQTGHDAFFMGEMRRFGIWYFYPVLLLIKTPIAFLLLTGAGVIGLTEKTMRSKSWQPLVPVLMAGMILLVVLPTTINIGIRHILIIYPLLALIAGSGVSFLWLLHRGRTLGRISVVVLMGWYIGVSAAAHPDYLAYFNRIPGEKPEQWVVGSGLDWGQDLYRLSSELKERQVPMLSLAYFGTADPSWFDFPPIRPVTPGVPVTGWVAASVSLLQHDTPEEDHFGWLKTLEPVQIVGKSIYLYHIPEE
jgi:hypothetical protein